MNTTNTDQSYIIHRTGAAPLAFNGELLAESDGAEPDTVRWHHIAVYRVATGRQYVVAIAYRSTWKLELSYDHAAIVASPAAVAAALADYNPISHVRGFPLAPAYVERQERLLRDIRERYWRQVSDVLASRPEFAERI